MCQTVQTVTTIFQARKLMHFPSIPVRSQLHICSELTRQCLSMDCTYLSYESWYDFITLALLNDKNYCSEKHSVQWSAFKIKQVCNVSPFFLLTPFTSCHAFISCKWGVTHSQVKVNYLCPGPWAVARVLKCKCFFFINVEKSSMSGPGN